MESIHGFACLILFLIYLNKPSTQQEVPIIKEDKLVVDKAVDKVATPLAINNQVQVASKEAIETITPLGVDSEAFKEIYRNFDLDSIDVINDDNRRQELVRLADAYPNELLLQMLAFTNCMNASLSECDSERFTVRMLKIDPNNAAARSFLASYFIKNDNYINALDELEKINPDNKFNTLFPESVEAVKNAVTNINQKSETLHKEKVKAIFEIAVVDSPFPQLFHKCTFQSLNNPQKERWQKACYRYASAMENSTTLLERSLAIALQKEILNITDSTIGLNEIIDREETLRQTMQDANHILDNDLIMQTSDYETWYQDFIKYGEIEAMRRLVERHKEITPK